MLNVKQGGIKYHFWVLGNTRPGIEPKTPGKSKVKMLSSSLFIYIC